MPEIVTVPGLAVADDRLLAVPAFLNGREYILLVDTRRPDATLLQRAASEWEPVDAENLDAAFELSSIARRLAMRDIYEGVTFEEAGRRRG